MSANFAADPLKVYQYLALGKPVVATEVEALRAIEGLVHIGRDHQEFLAAIAQELSKSTELAMREQRMAFAASTTWDKRWSALNGRFRHNRLLPNCSDRDSRAASVPHSHQVGIAGPGHKGANTKHPGWR